MSTAPTRVRSCVRKCPVDPRAALSSDYSIFVRQSLLQHGRSKKGAGGEAQRFTNMGREPLRTDSDRAVGSEKAIWLQGTFRDGAMVGGLWSDRKSLCGNV